MLLTVACLFMACKKCLTELIDYVLLPRIFNPILCPFGRELLRIVSRTLPFAFVNSSIILLKFFYVSFIPDNISMKSMTWRLPTSSIFEWILENPMYLICRM